MTNGKQGGKRAAAGFTAVVILMLTLIVVRPSVPVYTIPPHPRPVQLLLRDAPLADIVEAINESGGDVNNIYSSHGEFKRTFLEFAVKKGRRDVVQWALEHGARPTSGERAVLVQLAALNGDLAMAKQLLDSMGELSSGELSPALEAAIFRRNMAMIGFLIEHGADPDVKGNPELSTPREFAESLGDPDVIAAINRGAPTQSAEATGNGKSDSAPSAPAPDGYEKGTLHEQGGEGAAETIP